MSDISRGFEEVGKLDGAQKTEFLAMLKSLVRERPHLRIRIAAFQQDWNWLSKFSNGIRRLGEKFDDKDAPDAPAEERITFDVVLKSAGREKISVIKMIREVSSLGLKEAKELADMGGIVMEGLNNKVAGAVRKRLENLGADAELQPSHIVMGMHFPHRPSGCCWCREQDDPGE